MAIRARRVFIALALPPVVTTYAIHRTLSSLESRYPELPVTSSTCSAALRTPESPSTQRCDGVDIYATQVPLSTLLAPRTTSPDNKPAATRSIAAAWAHAVIGSRILRLEGSLFGLVTRGKFDPGDVGDSPAGFAPRPEPDGGERECKRELLNGVLVVERPPAPGDPYGLLTSWRMDRGACEFFETIARWGYPWRLVSGGRHEMSVSGPLEMEGRRREEEEEEEEGPFVEVRFASAHDYVVVPEEGERQKTIPGWVGRLHRGYARLILHLAVRELQQRPVSG
ncbi:hypothetical protein P175DRAFT_0500709 [Aspergillus ochraceoroseus IBT 24754]|uniref:Uncharacterized protein n=1 Tax=Aspergillus ochraceoroseus IBT 24754 TaxID=1392256 RepID=A0A2T5LZW3_9EURO|nr:uncharacterized protein P175DRAFT_0500709 [Aspergillus ochraceoroseus IBT 24754]PTU21824.1 hypothetical protein P175DRAFT_0500709 [Aspergillus ochraceoroseus IBT 24754]